MENSKHPLRFVSWNVNGIRSCLTKGMQGTIEKLNPDVLCLQEIKADNGVMTQLAAQEFPGYVLYNSSAVKKGYSGVATLVKKSIANLIEGHSTLLVSEDYSNEIQKHNSFFSEEGRFSIVHSKLFTLFNVYIPSGTSGESRQDLKYIFLDNFFTHLKIELKKKIPVILCGDFNICHRPIDIHHPKVAEQRQLTGYLPEERAWMDNLVNFGFIDCYREMAGDLPDVYSWWSYRAQSRPKNLGWRIDYFFCSSDLKKAISKVDIHTDIKGSDHCPVSVEFSL